MTEAAQEQTTKAATTDAPAVPILDAPKLEGSTAETQIGEEGSKIPAVDNEWLEVAKKTSPEIMRLPEVVTDGGRTAINTETNKRVGVIRGTDQDPLPPDPPPEVEAAPAEQEEQSEASEASGEESFVARADAERQRLYRLRTDDVKARQFADMQAENTRVRARNEEMLSPQQVGEQLRRDPFGFMREHGVGLQDLNKELDAGKASNPENGVSKEVFALQQQVAATNAKLQEMQQQAQQANQHQERQTALSTLKTGLDEYKESYPGLHALFGGDGSHTSPEEQVLIGLERAQQAGKPMSANEVAGRLENEARTHFERLNTAYKPAAITAPPTQQPNNHAVPQTAGITNQVAAPVRIPGRNMTRQEEIQYAASLLRFT